MALDSLSFFTVLSTPVQGKLLETYSQIAISGVNYHSYGANRGRRRGVI